MVGTIPVSEVLALASPDAADGDKVRDLVAVKRRSPHYQELLASIRRDGVTTPVVIRSDDDGRYLADGHHRVTAAADAGLTHVPWTDKQSETGPAWWEETPAEAAAADRRYWTDRYED